MVANSEFVGLDQFEVDPWKMALANAFLALAGPSSEDSQAEAEVVAPFGLSRISELTEVKDVRLQGFVGITKAQEICTRYGLPFEGPRQLWASSPDLFDQWVQNGQQFNKIQQSAFGQHFGAMLDSSASGRVVVRRYGTSPVTGETLTGATFNGASNGQEALENIQTLFKDYVDRGYTDIEAVKGFFVTEQVDSREITEIGRGTQLPIGGEAYVIRANDNGIWVKVRATFGDNALVARDTGEADIDEWVVFFGADGNLSLVRDKTKLAIKRNALFQRNSKPHPSAERLSDAHGKESDLWKLPLTQECAGRITLDDTEVMRMGLATVVLSLVNENPCRLEFSSGVIKGEERQRLFVNQVQPWKIDERMMNGEVEKISGRVVYTLLPNQQSMSVLNSLIDRQKVKDGSMIYLSPEFFKVRGGEAEAVLQKLFENNRVSLTLLAPITDTEHSYKDLKERYRGGHRLVALNQTLENLRELPWVTIVRAPGEGVTVVQSKRKFKAANDVALEVAAFRQFKGDVIDLKELRRRRIAVYEAVGGKAAGLLALMEDRLDGWLPPSLLLRNDLMKRLLAYVGALEEYNRIWKDQNLTEDGLREIYKAISDKIAHRELEDTQKTEILNSIRGGIRKHFRRAGVSDSKIALRTNLSAEDNPDYAFAGVFKSQLDVDYAGGTLLNRIYNVLESYFNPDVVERIFEQFTLMGRRELLKRFAVPILVQPMVSEVSVSGVLFTAEKGDEGHSGSGMGLTLQPGAAGGVDASGNDEREVIKFYYDPNFDRMTIVRKGKTVEGLDQSMVDDILGDLGDGLSANSLRGLFDVAKMIKLKRGNVDLEIAFGVVAGKRQWWILQQRPL